MEDIKSSSNQSVKSLVSEFQGYINVKDEHVESKEDSTCTDIEADENRPIVDASEERMKKIAALSTREEIEELDRKGSERDWRCFFLQKDVDLYNMEMMEKDERLRKTNQCNINHEDTDAENYQAKLAEKAIKARNWPLKKKISQLRSIHGLQLDKNDVQDYFNDDSQEHAFASNSSMTVLDASNSNMKHQQDKEVTRKRQVFQASPKEGTLNSVKSEDCIESVKKVTSLLAEMWNEVKDAKIKLKAQKQKITTLEDSISKERQIKERLQAELKGIKASKDDITSAQEDVGRINQHEVESDEANNLMPERKFADQNEVLQMQRNHLNLFKKLIGNNETRQNDFNTTITQRVENIEKEIRKIILYSDKEQHNCKEMISLKQKLHIANEIRNELQCIIEEKDKKIKLYENDLSKHMQKMLNNSMEENAHQAEIDEANMTIEQMQVAIDNQNDEIHNYALFAKELAAQLKEREEEVALVGGQLREELRGKDEQLETLEKNLSEADDENSHLNQKLEDLIDRLAQHSSCNLTKKSCTDLNKEKMTSELAEKDQQIEVLRKNLAESEKENKDLNQKIEDLIDDFADHASSNSIAKSAKDLTIEKMTSEVVDKDQQIEVLRKNLARSEIENKDHNQKIEDLIDDFADHASSNSIEKSAIDLTIEKMTSEVVDKDQQIEVLRKNLARSEIENKDHNQKIEDLIDDFADHASSNSIEKSAIDLTIEKMTLEMVEKDQQIEVLRKNLIKSDEEKKDLNQKIEDLIDDFADHASSNSIAKSAIELTIEKMTLEMVEKDQQIEVLRKNLIKSDEEKKDLNQKIEDLIDDFADHASSNSIEKSAIDLTIEKMTSDVVEKDQQIEVLRKNLIKSDEEKKDLNQKIEDLIDDFADHASSNSIAKSAKDLTIEKMTLEMVEKDQQIEVLRKNLIESDEEKKDLNQKIEDLIDDFADHSSSNSIAKSAKDLTIEKMTLEMVEKDQQIEVLRKNLIESDEEKKDLNQKIEDLIDDFADHASSNSIAKSAKDLTIEKMTSEVVEKDQQIEVLRKNLIKSDEEKKDLNLSDNEFVKNELRKIIDDKESENRSLTKHIFELKKYIGSLEIDLNEEKAKNKHGINENDCNVCLLNEKRCDKNSQGKVNEVDMAGKSGESRENNEVDNNKFVTDLLRYSLDEKEMENRSMAKRIFELKGDLRNLMENLDENNHLISTLSHKNQKAENEMQVIISQLRFLVKKINPTDIEESSVELEEGSLAKLIEYIEKAFDHYDKVMKNVEIEKSELKQYNSTHLKDLEATNTCIFAEEHNKFVNQNPADKEAIKDDEDKFILVKNELSTRAQKDAIEKLYNATEAKLKDMTALVNDLKQQFTNKFYVSEETQRFLNILLDEKEKEIVQMQDELKCMNNINENVKKRSKIIKEMKAQIENIAGIIEERNKTIIDLKSENRSLTNCVDDLYDFLASCVCNSSVNQAIMNIRQAFEKEKEDTADQVESISEEATDDRDLAFAVASSSLYDEIITPITCEIRKKVFLASYESIEDDNVKTTDCCVYNNTSSKALIANLSAIITSNNEIGIPKDNIKDGAILNSDMDSKDEKIKNDNKNAIYGSCNNSHKYLKTSDVVSASGDVNYGAFENFVTNRDGELNCRQNEHENLRSCCIDSSLASCISENDCAIETAEVQTGIFVDDTEALKYAERVSIDSTTSISSSNQVLEDGAQPVQDHVICIEQRSSDDEMKQFKQRNKN